MNKYYFFCLFLFSLTLQAQTTSETINANNIQATVNSNGALFWDFNNGQFLAPSASGDNISTIRSSGLWFGGIDPNGFLHGAVQMYNENGNSDFEPGLLNLDGEITDEFNSIWKVTKTDVDAHLADFNDNGVVDNPIASIFGYPGNQNESFFAYNNFELPFLSFGIAPFEDMNSNGRYEPDEGEYPIIEIRLCPQGESAVVPDEMLFFAYHDLKLHTESQLEPFNISIHVEVFAFNCNENPIMNNTVFVRQKILHLGETPLDSTHIAVFTDFDIGCANDDFVGCDPERDVYFAYNGDNEDSGCNNAFGSSPPVQTVAILRGPHDNFGDIISPNFYVPFGYDNGNMGTPAGFETFKYLSGTWNDGTPMENNGVFYDGDPANSNEWSEVSAGNTPGDRRMLATFGPFKLDPGAINEVIVAYTAHQPDPNLSHLENVSAIKSNTNQIRAAFDNCFLDVCSFTVGTNTPPIQSFDLHIFPNPNDGNFVLEYESGNSYEVLDVAGKVVASGALTTLIQRGYGSHTFDVSELNHGIYFLKVTGDLGIDISKFVVK